MPLGTLLDRRWIPPVLLVLLGLLASVSSLGNGFAYDDIHIILQNDRVHALAAPWRFFAESYWPPVVLGPGGRLYRPLTILAFAIQWSLGGGLPLVFHLVSVGLYLAILLAVYGLARTLLPVAPAWLAAAIFAVHPVHVEAVANVVGQGELWAALFLTLGVTRYLENRAGGLDGKGIAWIAGCYLMACLAKENGIVLPGLIAAAGVVIPGQRSWKARAEEFGRLGLALGLVAIVYLRYRTAVLGELAGDTAHVAIAQEGFTERLLTMLGVVNQWLRLFLWPAHLQADYSPQEIPVTSSVGIPQLTGTVILLLAGAAAVVLWRRRPVITLGILWAAIALAPVCNLITRSGVLLAERTLFVSSIGVALVLGALGGRLGEGLRSRGRNLRLAAGVSLGALLALAVVRSVVRQPVWRDNETLFRQTVLDAPRSYWARRSYAGNLFLAGRTAEAEREYHASLALFDRDPAVWDDLGSMYRQTERCTLAIPAFRRSVALEPAREVTRIRLISCLVRDGQLEEARAEAVGGIERGHQEFRALLAIVDSAARGAPGSKTGP